MSDRPTPAVLRRRLIWFCQTESVARQPESLRVLRDQIGLTTIMPESPVCHTSGFAASAELAERSPFADWRSRLDRWPGGRDGVYPPVAGVLGGVDDGPLRTVLEHCARLGIEVWGHVGLWSYGGDVYPEYAMRTLDGQPLAAGQARWGIGLCPSRPRINEWVRAGLVEVVSKYGLTGLCVDHARYPGPASLSSLSGCGCQFCQDAAAGLGLDFGSIRAGVRGWLEERGQLDARRLQALLAGRGCGWELAELRRGGGVLAAWLDLRAALLAARMQEFRVAVRSIGGAGFVFGSDVFAPSVAWLGGQPYDLWERHVDFLTGGSSHGGVVGWATAVPDLASAWAPALGRAVPGLGEAAARALIYRLFGLDDLELAPGVPQTAAAGPFPLAELYAREVQRLVAVASGRVPLYPPISAHGDTGQVEALCRAVTEARCQGAMLSLDPARADILATIARHLRP